MFYDNFIRLCNESHKSPSSVATEIGFSRASVSGWKNGKNPTDATILKIADYFNVSADCLISRDQKEKPAAKSDEPDIKDILLDTKAKAAKGITLMYNGKPINERTMKAFEASLEAAIALLESSQEE